MPWTDKLPTILEVGHFFVIKISKELLKEKFWKKKNSKKILIKKISSEFNGRS